MLVAVTHSKPSVSFGVQFSFMTNFRPSPAQERRSEVLDTVRPVLCCFAKEIFHLGPVGAGNVMKLVIQSIFLSQMAGFLEAVSMGERSGIALDTLLCIVAASSAHHPAIGTRYEKLRSGNLDPMFEVGSARDRCVLNSL